MSTQSIINKTKSDLLHQIDDIYIREGNKYLNEIHYDVNLNIDMFKIKMVIMADEILSSNICLNTKKLEEKIKTTLI